MSNAATPSIEHIQGEPLNPVQKNYLQGFFAGISARGITFGDFIDINGASSGSATSTHPAAPQDDTPLIVEERYKREEHPLDSYYRIVEHARLNKAPDKEDTFRFKWNGLFYLTPVKDAFMARLRIPGGQLRTFQLRELANIARELTSGYVQITTRANFQLRLIQPKDMPAFLRRVQSVGLHTRGAGADNIRNLTANPTAGVDPYELIDTLPYCHELGEFILAHREFYDLPRKFNIAFDGGGLIGTVEDTNDIGFRAVLVKEGAEAQAAGIAPGVYFRVALGGATGHKSFARDLGVLVPPDRAVQVAIALVRVFIANGNRGDRKKARLKHLLDKWTLDQYLKETEKLLPQPLIRDSLDANGKSPIAQPSELPPTAHSHVGVFPQKQKGFNYIGVTIPVGQITPKQMTQLADIADNYGCGELRLTVWQNLILPGIPDAYVETVKKRLVSIGLHWKQSNLSSGFIACTGNAYCKFSSSNTKGHALAAIKYLERRITLDHPVNIHLTGCPNSCAQHFMGDIGLLGTKVKNSVSGEGYHIFLGGGFGDNKAVGRQIFQGIAAEELSEMLEKILKGYLRHRTEGETFQSFTNRHDVGTLQAWFTNNE
ncbi:MAG: NirA family protein [Candidatus Methylacidiphilales bacterium]|nr:NirA family protein [Candidatus Methylacidiphilales bacterium]